MQDRINELQTIINDIDELRSNGFASEALEDRQQAAADELAELQK